MESDNNYYLLHLVFENKEVYDTYIHKIVMINISIEGFENKYNLMAILNVYHIINGTFIDIDLDSAHYETINIVAIPQDYIKFINIYNANYYATSILDNPKKHCLHTLIDKDITPINKELDNLVLHRNMCLLVAPNTKKFFANYSGFGINCDTIRESRANIEWLTRVSDYLNSLELEKIVSLMLYKGCLEHTLNSVHINKYLYSNKDEVIRNLNNGEKTHSSSHKIVYRKKLFKDNYQEEILYIIHMINTVINNMPATDHSFTVHRSMNGTHSHEVGEIFNIPNFWSSSLSHEISDKFGNIKYTINIPVGAKVLPIGDEVEDEILFNSGAQMTIVSITDGRYLCEFNKYNS